MSEQRPRQAVPPALPQASATPGYPSSADVVRFETFNGIDTKSPRPVVDPRIMAWCDGFMPIGTSFIRVLPGIGPNIYSAPDGLAVVWFSFGNIGSTPYGVVLLSDGSMQAFNTDTGAVSQVMPPGTITTPRTQFGFSQWGSQYLLFTADQPNGYWIWDGTNLFGPGTLAPIVTVTNNGSGYTSPPNVDRKSTRLNSSHEIPSRMPSSA